MLKQSYLKNTHYAHHNPQYLNVGIMILVLLTVVVGQPAYAKTSKRVHHTASQKSRPADPIFLQGSVTTRSLDQTDSQNGTNTIGTISNNRPSSVVKDDTNNMSVVAQKTSRAYLQRFVCPTSGTGDNHDCFLFFQPFDVGGMTIQAICNDCFLDWQRSRNSANEINLNNRLALIRTDLQPYRNTGKNWYVIKWLTLID